MSDVPPLPTFGGESDESDDGSQSAGWTQHSVWNHLLDLLTLEGSSPRIQLCLQEEEPCRTALDVPFRPGRYLHVHGVVATWFVLLEEAKIWEYTRRLQRDSLHDEATSCGEVDWSHDDATWPVSIVGNGSVAPLRTQPYFGAGPCFNIVNFVHIRSQTWSISNIHDQYILLFLGQSVT